MLAEVDDALSPLSPSSPPVRPVGRDHWHVTLAFHGEDDEATRTAALRTALAGCPAPQLRLVGFGTFATVGWLGVVADATLTALAVAAGAGTDRSYRPHLTIARWPAGHDPGQQFAALTEFRSTPWTATEVVLMASQRTPTGPRYTPCATVELTVPERGTHRA